MDNHSSKLCNFLVILFVFLLHFNILRFNFGHHVGVFEQRHDVDRSVVGEMSQRDQLITSFVSLEFWTFQKMRKQIYLSYFLIEKSP